MGSSEYQAKKKEVCCDASVDSFHFSVQIPQAGDGTLLANARLPLNFNGPLVPLAVPPAIGGVYSATIETYVMNHMTISEDFRIA